MATVGDADELMTAVERHQPDLAIVDVRMPPTHTDDGLRAALADPRRAGRRSASSCCRSTSRSGTPPSCSPARPAAIGYLLKDRVADVSEFLGAVRRVGDGGTALDPRWSPSCSPASAGATRWSGCRPRSARCSSLMAEGRTNPAIARSARRERQGGREARRQHLRQARPAARRRRPPPRAGGPAMGEE